MKTTRRAPGVAERDELDDSWFDLPALVPAEEVPMEAAPARPRQPEDELDDSWFDRPGRGIRRADVLGH